MSSNISELFRVSVKSNLYKNTDLYSQDFDTEEEAREHVKNIKNRWSIHYIKETEELIDSSDMR